MYPEDFDFPNGCPMCRFFPPPPPPPGGMGGPQGGGPPSGPPPAYTPQKAQAKSMHAQGPGGPSALAVEAGGIRFCRFKFTYIWLENGRSFWAFITFVGRRSIAGWRWNGRFWVYFGIDLRRIDSFICY